MSDEPLPDTLTPLSLSKSQEQNEIKLPWGRLYSFSRYIKSTDLFNDKFSVGREESCDLIITESNFPKTCKHIGRKHFIIYRDSHLNLEYLGCESKNGTYVNGEKVDKGKNYILQHDDIISVGLRGSQKLFTYKLLEFDDSLNYLPNILKKKYKLSKHLGKGACGDVHLIYERSTFKPYAVKKINKGNNSNKMNHPKKIFNETEILKSVSHPFIINMNDLVETDTDVFIILEYMAGGELSKRILSIQPFTEQNVKFIFYQLAIGVQYLHNKGITHRDLKPDNVLLLDDAVEPLIKITDFGLSKFLGELGIMNTVCGTPNYVAPEVIDGACTQYSKKVDIWSLGVILFYMLSKELPFKGGDKNHLNRNILNGRFSFNSKNWKGISSSVKNLVVRMLIVNPIHRYSINDVLEHDWIAQDLEVQHRVNQSLKNDTDYIIFDNYDDLPYKRIKLLETSV